MNPAVLSSERMDWQTPDCVLDLVRQVGRIALDPCTTDENPCGAWRIFTPAEDGLAQSWTCGGLCFVNPPYGRAVPKWIDKCVEEARRGVEILALVPSRTDTKWYRRAAESASALRHWHGRIKFRGAEHAAPFPSVLIYWGPRADVFHSVFAGRTVVGGVGSR